MKKEILVSICIGLGFLALVPLINLSFGQPFPWISTELVTALNLIAWCVIINLLYIRYQHSKTLLATARRLGLTTYSSSFERLLIEISKEVSRKKRSLSNELIERKISTKEELSETLEKIVALAYELLDADAAELALFDSQSGTVHSAFVLGKPFRSSAQAMLSGALDGVEEKVSTDVLVQPIAFAGTVLGSLRVGLKRGTLPSISDRELLSVLAVQGSLAIINAEYTQELLKMKQQSDETVKAKTGFLANLSHEIRGPLGIIINAVELVIDELCGPLTTDQAETLALARTHGEHLLELINDVLDYAKVESGRLQPKPQQITVNDLLNEMHNIVRTQAEAKAHKLLYHEPDELLYISCDRRHIRQMLINLLTNAIKYTPDGGTIDVWAERVAGGMISLHVRDTGIGIDESDHNKVFQAFERISNSYAAKQVGTGLGMPLTRKLAEVNGGKIDFSSERDKGSHFWLIFPSIQPVQDLPEKIDDQSQEVPKGRGEAVLILESDEGERNMLGKYLSHLGYKAVPVQSKLELIETVKSGDIDLLLLDNKAIDGLDENFTNSIRTTARSSLLPIILVTSRAFVFDIEKYLKAGIDICLSKPIALSELGRTVRSLLDGKHSAKVDPSSRLEEKSGTKEKSPLKKDDLNPDDFLH